jgi:RHS repeat-associated protein
MGFAGMERDLVTGLNLAVHRVQNPGTGRWTSPDPLGFAAGDADLYRDADNSVPNFADPTGQDIYIVPGDPIALGYRHCTIIVYDPKSGWYKDYNGSGPGGSQGSPDPINYGGTVLVPSMSPIKSGPFPTYGVPPILVEKGNFNLQVGRLNWAFRRTKQIQKYCALGGPNSNTWAAQFLINGGYNPPTPGDGVATGWDNPAYGGPTTIITGPGVIYLPPGWDRWGNPLPVNTGMPTGNPGPVISGGKY